MNALPRRVLVAAGVTSAAIALLQIVIYLGGPSVYRTFGAPPPIADQRALEPLRMLSWSAFWFSLFSVFALYAFSGARLIRPLPYVGPVLLVIAAIFGVRGLAVIPQLLFLNQFPVTRARDVAFSTLSLVLGWAYATGARGWRAALAAFYENGPVKPSSTDEAGGD